jgi:cation-transporting P-type ATPase J
VDDVLPVGALAVVADNAPAGILALADQLRPGAADTVAELTTLTSTAPALLTGDNARAATTLAAQIGITDIRAGLLPQDTVTAVELTRVRPANLYTNLTAKTLPHNEQHAACSSTCSTR